MATATGLAGSQGALREANRRRLLSLLHQRGPLSRAELARLAGLSRSTVSNIVTELAGATLLHEVREPEPPERRGRAGRPGALIAVNPAAGAVIGVDVDHECLRIGVADLSHTILAEEGQPLDVDHDASGTMDAAVQMISRVLRRAGIGREKVLGVGMALPGPIDRAAGRAHRSGISPSWVGVEAAGEMRRRLGLPVFLDNDANLGALAEIRWGAARGVTEAAYVKAGTGMGAALIVHGEVYRGGVGTAGEIGHIAVSGDGPMCRCGNRGCLETYAGGRYLAELLRPTHGDGLTTARIVELALAGDAPCRRAVADAGRYVGQGAASLCNLLNPSLIVVGGDLARAGDLLLEPMVEAVGRSAVSSAAALVSIVPGVLGDRSEVLGALALVMNAWETV
jgi:predicted NBD/HSP70 family sugar kinase